MAQRRMAGLAVALCVGASFLSTAASFDGPTTALAAFVTVEGTGTHEDAAELETLGLRVAKGWSDFGVFLVVGSEAGLRAAAELPRVVKVMQNEPLEWLLSTSAVVTGARAAWDTKSTSRTPVEVNGRIVDGTGVGIAIVDTGIDATHPDLASAVAVNRRWMGPPTYIEAPLVDTGIPLYPEFPLVDGCEDTMWVEAGDTDWENGHGTHVAGIAAGRGTVSGGRFVGMAPGATLYGLGIAYGVSEWAALEALAWVYCNHDKVAPAIRVVSNSWGKAGSFDPDEPINRAVSKLVGEGITVVFAAGNWGGDGYSNMVNRFAKNPARGVLSVANYADADAARRSGFLSSDSSRGDLTEAPGEQWPDVAAPGTSIASTNALTGAYLIVRSLDLKKTPYYVVVGGTSMAAPHVSGIFALLLQANGSLTPGELEDLVEDTAFTFPTAGTGPNGYGYADPQNPTSGTNFAAGHGLVDALRALHDPRVGAAGGTTLVPLRAELSYGQAEPYGFQQFPGFHSSGLDLWPPIVAGLETGLVETSMKSGDPERFPLAAGQPACFRILPPDNAAWNACAASGLRSIAQGYEMAVKITLPEQGTYVVEAQVAFEDRWYAFDQFELHVV